MKAIVLSTMNILFYALYWHQHHVVDKVLRNKRFLIEASFLFSSTLLGYFSLLNDRGHASATTYTTIIQLVRERVYKFLSVDTLTAYSESPQSGKNQGNVIVIKKVLYKLIIYLSHCRKRFQQSALRQRHCQGRPSVSSVGCVSRWFPG